MNIFQSLSTPHREIPELCLACITLYDTTFAGRCGERPPINLRYYMICGKESATLQKSAPRARRLVGYTIKKTFFQLKSLKNA